MKLVTKTKEFSFEKVLQLCPDPIRGEYDNYNEGHLYHNLPLEQVLIIMTAQEAKQTIENCTSEIKITDTGYQVTVGWIEAD